MPRTLLVTVLILSISSTHAQASPSDLDDLFRGGDGIVFDHPPLPSGGPASDTDFINSAGQQSWQQLADNFVLNSDAVIRRVRWWGFYGANFGGNHEPPAGPETMRLRVYGDATPSGPPDDGNVLFEESFLNLQRTATGRTIGIGGLPEEFVYEVGLTSPLALDASTTYWIEIVQVGDLDSLFRWEYAWEDVDDFAFVSAFFPSWQLSTTLGDLAFQLSTVPEPATLIFALIGGMLLLRRNRKEDTGG